MLEYAGRPLRIEGAAVDAALCGSLLVVKAVSGGPVVVESLYGFSGPVRDDLAGAARLPLGLGEGESAVLELPRPYDAVLIDGRGFRPLWVANDCWGGAAGGAAGGPPGPARPR